MNTLFGLTPQTVNMIITVLRAHRGVEKAIIYGSRAKGNYREGSDIDMTLVGDDLPWREMAVLEDELDDLMLPYRLDLSSLDELENPDLLDHINRVGKVIYER